MSGDLTRNPKNEPPIQRASVPSKPVDERRSSTSSARGNDKQRLPVVPAAATNTMPQKAKGQSQRVSSLAFPNEGPSSESLTKKRRLSNATAPDARRRARTHPPSPNTPAQEAQDVLDALSTRLLSIKEESRATAAGQPSGAYDQNVKIMERCQRSLAKMLGDGGRYEKRIEDLEEELADAIVSSSNVKVLEARNRALIDENKAHAAKAREMESDSASKDSLAREIEALRKELAAQQSAVTERDTTIKEYEDAAQHCDHLQLEISKLTAGNRELALRNSTLNDNSKASLREIETIKAQLAMARASTEKLEQDKAEWADLQERLESDIKAKERIMAAKNVEVLELRQQIKPSASDTEARLGGSVEQDKEVARLNHLVASLKEEAKTGQRWLVELERLREWYRQQGQELTRTKRHREQAATNFMRNEATRKSQLEKLTAEYESQLKHLRSQLEGLSVLLRQSKLREAESLQAHNSASAERTGHQSAQRLLQDEKAKMLSANVKLLSRLEVAELGRDALAVVLQRNFKVVAANNERLSLEIDKKFNYLAELESIKAEVTSLKWENSSQATATNAFRSKLAAVEKERDQLKAQSQQAQQDIAELKQRLTQPANQKEGSMVSLKNKLPAGPVMEGPTQHLRDLLRQKEAEVQQSSAKLNCVQADLLHHQSQLSIANDELQTVKQQLAGLNERAEKARAMKLDLCTLSDQVRASRVVNILHRAAHRTLMSRLRQDNEKLTRTFHDCEAELVRINFELKRVREENTWLDGRLEESNLATIKLEKDLADQKEIAKSFQRQRENLKAAVGPQAVATQTRRQREQSVACQTEPETPQAINTALPFARESNQLPTPLSSENSQRSTNAPTRKNSNMSPHSGRPFNPPSGPRRRIVQEPAGKDRHQNPAAGRGHATS